MRINWSVGLGAMLLGAGLGAAPGFRPGEVWRDTGGQPIQAHGGGILAAGDAYYWYGEDRTPGRHTQVSCYSSTNLYDWKDEGVVLTNGAVPAPILERPKVIFNPRTGRYVMWMHLEQRGGYHYSRAGIATSDRPTGPFVFQKALRPIPEDIGYRDRDPDRQKEFGGTYRDMNLFVDDDGEAYAFYASEGNWTMYVVRLNEDFTGPALPAVQNQTWARILIRRMREAPAPFKYRGRYYLITSACTGWAPNAADYAVADNILGPYESQGNPCVGTNADRTFGCQSTFVLPAPGRPGDFIALFDLWKPRQLSDSRYVWLPLNLQRDGAFTLAWRNAWDLSVFGSPPARNVVDLDDDWRFCKGDFPTAVMPAFDDSGWRRVNVPHDWSSEGPFRPEWASGTGYAPGGLGWYRRRFRLDPAQRGQAVTIEFDGVYDHAEVWINGQFVGGRPYGYSTFQCDLTPYVHWGAAGNVVAVRVDHSRFADSRWYTGSGLYRHVRLCLTDRRRIAPWGTSVTTPRLTAHAAVVRVETTVQNGSGKKASFSLASDILSPDGQVVASLTTGTRVGAGAARRTVQVLKLRRPRRWSLESPTLYTLRSRLKTGPTVVDETRTPFGIRTAEFDPNRGFLLNGTAVKLKGVCLHHDAGCLGAAVPDQVLERRLRALKEIGVNAIRTSHNPPAPEFLDLCDRLGLLVMDEAFDEFTPSKNKWVGGRNTGLPSRFGYGEEFARWSVTDVQNLVRRDRNHPCVILWSIGNEIDYANDPFSHPVLGDAYRPANPPAQDMVRCAKPLLAAVQALDRTRPVTMALANVAMSEAVGLPELLDVVGYNYQETRYPADHRKHPRRVLLGSETSQQYGAWTAVRDHEYVAGQFLWTGIDYLGEARPWPNRANGAGLLDLCGFKKPLAWFRQSLWSDQPMVYLCVAGGDRGPRGFGAEESWNWPSNRTVTVRCYANCPEVTLSLNGQVLGTKRLSDARNGALNWTVAFEPGVLRAEGRADGGHICESTLRTAGPASRIALRPDVTQLRADGKDICHVEFQIVDRQGVRVPDARPEVTFDVGGPARLLGLGNADLDSAEDGKGRSHEAYHGQGLAILQSTTAPGPITLTATAPGLEPAHLTLSSRMTPDGAP